MNRMLLGLVLLIAALSPLEASAQTGGTEDIATGGKLRYGLNLANAALSSRAPDGSLSGIAVAFGTFIAGKLGVPFAPVLYESTGAFTRSFAKGEWDITVVGTSPAAKKTFNFTPDLLLVDYVYLAAPGRSFASIADVDRPGIKVGASENGSGSQFLAANLKFAKLVLGAGEVEDQIELLRSGKVDVYGSNTNNLLLVAARLPGAAFIPGGAFFSVHFAVALPKDRSPASVAKMTALLAEAKQSGFVQEAIEKAGLKGVRVAPQ
jgi:polar amino acid transport system substrate-binding protein